MRLLIEVLLAVLVLAVIALVVGKRHARRFQRARQIRIDRFKLKRRHAEIELEVFGSREVVDAIRGYAKEHHVSIEEATQQARTYLREIVPKFNLLAYYRFGAPLARAIMHFLYRPVVERKPMREFNDTRAEGRGRRLHHQSPLERRLRPRRAHALQVHLALVRGRRVGARLAAESLFKWFGGYFVRRRYREPLYHAVLSKFVQTITQQRRDAGDLHRRRPHARRRVPEAEAGDARLHRDGQARSGVHARRSF